MVSVWVSIRIEFPCLLPHCMIIYTYNMTEMYNHHTEIYYNSIQNMCVCVCCVSIILGSTLPEIARETIHNIIYKTPYRFAGKSTS